MTFDRDNEMDFENRVIAPEYVPEDAEVENPLRPRTFADYVGQEKVKENLEVFIQAAKQRKESLDHGFCSTARRVSAKRRLRASLQTSSVSICASRVARPSKSRRPRRIIDESESRRRAVHR